MWRAESATTVDRFRVLSRRCAGAALASLTALALGCAPASAQVRYESHAGSRVVAAQQAPAGVNASDPEQRGAHIPDPPTRPAHPSDDDPSDVDERTGGSEGGGGTPATGTSAGSAGSPTSAGTTASTAAARQALPRTGGSGDALLLLYFGSLLVLAGVGIRMYAKD